MIALLLAACTVDKPAPADPGETAAPDTADTTDTDTDLGPSDPLVDALAVTVHPEVATVLVATWNQLEPADTWLSWELDGETYTSPVTTTAAGPATAYVFGLPADTAVDVTVHAAFPGSDPSDQSTLTVPATTGPLPADLPAPTLVLAEPTADPAPFLLTSVNAGSTNFFGPCYTVLLDRQGRIVWYRLTSDRRLTLFPRVARSGAHLYWDATTYYVSGEPTITRATLSLRQVGEVSVPSMGFTWDELPDGSFVYDEAETPYDYHLARYQPTPGSQERLWSCAPWMAPYSTEYWACAANTVLWDDATGTVLYSMFQTSTIVAIDADSGEIAWELGEYPGGLAFDPADVHLQLQHYPNWTPDGTLLLTTHVPGAREQHIRELAIADGVATQVWDYTADGYYGDYAGEATRLSGGNTLIGFGTDGVLREVTPDREVAWELDWADHLVGHVTPIDDLYALDRGW